MFVQLAERTSSEAALQTHEQQLKDALNQKLTEHQQLMKIIEVLKRHKDEQEGVHLSSQGSWQSKHCTSAEHVHCSTAGSTFARALTLQMYELCQCLLRCTGDPGLEL